MRLGIFMTNVGRESLNLRAFITVEETRGVRKKLIIKCINMESNANTLTSSMSSEVSTHKAKELIRTCRCNSVVNFNRHTIPLEVWNSIQELIINNAVYPPVTTIHLRNTNLTGENIDDKLRPMVTI